VPITRRIYASLAADHWLPDNLNALKWGVVEEIEKLGYMPEVFTNPRENRGWLPPGHGARRAPTTSPDAVPER
jgi:hypothetical protein